MNKAILEFVLEEKGYLTFPNYNINLAQFAKAKWEKRCANLFTFDEVAVDKRLNHAYAVFNIKEDLSSNELLHAFLTDFRYRRFVLSALVRELKSCGLANNMIRINVGFNFVGNNDHHREKIRAFCEEKNFIFWGEEQQITFALPKAA